MHFLHMIVQGRVQGVGYRNFITVAALRLGLRGEVRNLPDGDVEVIAEGQREALERMIDRARSGPPRAVVTNVVVQWGEGPQRYSRFGNDA
jgi:acylphosphatase